MIDKKQIKKRIYGDKIQFKKLEILDIEENVLSLQIRRLKAGELQVLMQDLSKGKTMEELQQNEKDMQEFVSGLIKNLVYLDGELLFETEDDMLSMDAIVFTQISNGVINILNIA